MIHILYVLYIHRHFDVMLTSTRNTVIVILQIKLSTGTVQYLGPSLAPEGSGDHFLPMRTLSILEYTPALP